MRKKKRLALGLFFGFLFLGLLPLWPSLQTDFLCDDFGIIHALVKDGFSVITAEVPLHWFRPITLASFWMEYGLWGLHPLGFHLTNILLHVLASAMLTLLCHALLEGILSDKGHSRILAVGCGLFFLMNPSHSESICWISGRGDILAVLFSLLAIFSAMKGATTGKSGWHLGACVAMGGGLLCKEAVLLTPATMLLFSMFALWSRGTSPWKCVKRTVPWGCVFGLISALYVLIRAWRLGELWAGYGAEVHLNIWSLDALRQGTRLVLRSLLPAIPVSWNAFWAHQEVFLLLGLLLGPLLLGVGMLLLREGKPYVLGFLLCAFCLFTALLPALGLWTPLHWLRGERFVYYPSVFVGLLLVLVIYPSWKRRPALVTLSCVFYGFLFLGTLHASALKWKHASKISRQVIQDIRSQTTSQEILILNAPESIDYVYVWWNSLEAALFLSDLNPEPHTIQLLTLQWLSREHPHCSVLLERNEGGTPILRLYSPTGSLVPANDSVQCPTPHQAVIQPHVAGPRADTFLWSGGKMWRLGPWGDVLGALTQKGWMGGQDLERCLGASRSVKLDSITCDGQPFFEGGNVISWKEGKPLPNVEIIGYALDKKLLQPVRDVFLCVDGHRHFLAQSGIERKDVVKVLKEDNYLNCGFGIHLDPSSLGPGQHHLILKGIAADGRGYILRTLSTPLILRIPEGDGQIEP